MDWERFKWWWEDNWLKVAIGAFVVFVLLGISFGYVPEWPM